MANSTPTLSPGCKPDYTRNYNPPHCIYIIIFLLKSGTAGQWGSERDAPAIVTETGLSTLLKGKRVDPPPAQHTADG